jgi:hypothetical protein
VVFLLSFDLFISFSSSHKVGDNIDALKRSGAAETIHTILAGWWKREIEKKDLTAIAESGTIEEEREMKNLKQFDLANVICIEWQGSSDEENMEMIEKGGLIEKTERILEMEEDEKEKDSINGRSILCAVLLQCPPIMRDNSKGREKLLKASLLKRIQMFTSDPVSSFSRVCAFLVVSSSLGNMNGLEVVNLLKQAGLFDCVVVRMGMKDERSWNVLCAVISTILAALRRRKKKLREEEVEEMEVWRETVKKMEEEGAEEVAVGLMGSLFQAVQHQTGFAGDEMGLWKVEDL